MYQDITLPVCATTLTWDMEYASHARPAGFGFDFDANSQYSAVHIRDLGDVIQTTLFKTTEGVDPQSIPMTSFTADISAFAGQTVRLDIDHQVQNSFFDAAWDNFAVSPEVCDIEVDLDIKPGSDPNAINCTTAKGVIPVAILTTSDFDATTVDHTTVTFEGASEIHVSKKTGVAVRHVEDVDDDGDLDLVFHFRFGDTGLTCDSSEGTLTGEPFDGTPVSGTDAVHVIDVP